MKKKLIEILESLLGTGRKETLDLLADEIMELLEDCSTCVHDYEPWVAIADPPINSISKS